MKRFLKNSLLFIIILGIVIVLCLVVIPPNHIHYLYSYRQKIERLDSLSSPRLIIAGGSNTAFGLDSREIQDSIKMNVVNLGLHTGIGLRFMTDDILRRSREGDVVVFMPEYSQFYDLYFGKNDALPHVVMYSDSNAWELLNLQQKLIAISGITTYIGENINAKTYDDWSYSALNFNEFGDEEAHRTAPSPPLKTDAFLIDTPFNVKGADDFAEKIALFHKKGVNTIFFWPITIRSNYLANDAIISEIEDQLRNRDIHFSIPPDYFVGADSLAFDTPYHLNGAGVKEMTKRFISAIRSEK